MVCDSVDRVVLERDRIAKPLDLADAEEELDVRRIPRLGTAVPGLEMKIVDPETYAELPERHVGELLIRGTSVTPGYYKRPDATAALFHDGLAVHRRPGLHRRRRTGAVRSDQGRDHRRAVATCSRRTSSGRAARSTACAPAT